ncbi:hypothetical protein F2P56_006747 [Juglans regia]|uniref:Non-specific lipid-transfer protein n=2 Tax=Juglans regia TaxID=51240 RepID=A0A834CYN3_JUGRE|nr:hypothetical protein F2P56_006747 [Juglans regia]
MIRKKVHCVKKMRGLSALAFGLVILTLISACHSEAIPCPEVTLTLLPCRPFLVGTRPDYPGFSCCLGVQRLNREASMTNTRKALCRCFKKAASGLHVDVDKAKQLPQLCNVNNPVPIDPNVNCNKFQ